jgi:hypothetical protein
MPPKKVWTQTRKGNLKIKRARKCKSLCNIQAHVMITKPPGSGVAALGWHSGREKQA